MIDWQKPLIIKNVNTIADRKKVITSALKYCIKKSKIIVFLHQSFWHAFYFHNLFKNKYKNLVKFYPKYTKELNYINFTDYPGFLKFLIKSSSIPEDIYLFIFDFDILLFSKYYPLYDIIFQEGIKFSATFSSLAHTSAIEQLKHIEKIYKLKSSFRIKTTFKTLEKFSTPSRSIFFCFDKNALYKIIQKEI